MLSWREFESEKQSRCREENDAAARLRRAAKLPAHRVSSFQCECGDAVCTRLIALTAAEYESVRSHGTRFLIAPDHENPETEQVVLESQRFAVVETVTGGERSAARRSDPRQRIQEERWAHARSSEAGSLP